MNAAQFPQRVGEGFTQSRIVNTQHLPLDKSRVSKWSQHIEQCAHGKLATRPDRVFHGTVVSRRKEKPDAN